MLYKKTLHKFNSYNITYISYPIKTKFLISLFFLLLNFHNIKAFPPEIHYIDPPTMPTGTATNITTIGKNFTKNLDIFLSSKNILLLSKWNILQSIEDIYVQKDNVYLACGEKGLLILQLKNQFQPDKLLGSFSTKTSITKVFVEENYCYIADNNKLYILNLIDLSNITIVSTFNLLNPLNDLYINNGYIYVGFGKNGMQVIKTKPDPSRPKLVFHSTSFFAYNFILRGDILYISAGENGFILLDNKTPERPLQINTFQVSGFVNYLYEDNNHIFLATEKGGIQIFESFSKTSPELLKKINAPPTSYLTVKGNYIYCITGTQLLVIDIKNISEPKIIKVWQNENLLNKIAYDNEFLFTIDKGGNLQILSNILKIKNYRFLDPNLITVMIPKEIPDNIYDLILINKDTGEIGQIEKALTITKALPMINFITPSQLISDEKKQIILIGQNFAPGATVKIDTTLASNAEVHSQGKINFTYSGNLPVGSYDISVKNPDGQSAILKQSFNVIEKSFSINKSDQDFYYQDDINRKITITGEKINKTNKIFLWGNGTNRLSSCDTPGNAATLAISQNYCFVADEDKGLTIIDISNPSFPVVINNEDTPGLSSGITLFHHWVYIADGEYGIEILDVSHPEKPIRVWSVDTIGYAYALAIKKNFIYVADGKAGLSIFEVENQYNLNLVSRVKVNGSIYGLSIKDNFIFLASGDVGLNKGEGIIVLDITNPSNPQLVTSLKTAGSANAVQIVNNLLFVANGEEGLLVIDISDPTQPKEFGKINLGVNLFNLFIDKNAEYAYVAAGKNGFYIIDVKFPNNPYPISLFRTIDSANSIVVVNKIAYVACSKAGIEIIDVSNPINPMHINSSGRLSSTIDVVNNGNTCFLADQFYGLVLINTEESRQNTISELKIDGKPMGIETINSFVYIASGEKGLKIFSIQDPQKPSLLSELSLPGYAYNIFLDNNKAYISCVEEGVSIVDISNSKKPVLLSSFKTNDKAYQCFVKDKYAYIADYISGLLISDVSSSSEVINKGSISTRGFANDIFVKDKYAYVAASDIGLVIVDISDPQAPKLVSSCKTEGPANGIQIDGNIAFLSCIKNGISFINIANPSAPFLIGNYFTFGSAYNITLKNKKIYVADGNFGLSQYHAPIIIDNFSIQDENTLSFQFPSDIPVGAYNLTLINENESQSTVKYNLFKILKR